MKRVFVTIGVVFVILTIIAPSQLYASPTTEDDGWVEGDYEGSFEEQEEQAQEDWEDAGRPGDNDNNDDDNNNPNPYCDKVSDEYMQSGGVCHDRLDYDDVTGLAPCNDGTQKADWRDCKDATKSKSSNGNGNGDDIPECQNGVTQECVISAIGLICRPGYDLSNPNIVGGGHACQDIYAGIYKPQPEPEPESNLKNCGDGIVAVSCGVGRYWCPGSSTRESFHTNDYRDCEDA
jgi:hypothetical protein